MYDELYKERQEATERERTRRNFDKLRRQQSGRGSLVEFVRYYWHTLEPKSRKLVEGWPLEAICLHLEAVTFGDINRLLINVPPGFMKSLLTDVFWPAWEWGPMNMPHTRYVAFSYSEGITTRDNNKMTRLILSQAYRDLWGDRFTMTKLGETKIENDQTGFKLATSVGGRGTGERGDRVILDDPHNVIKMESQMEREKTVRFFRESMSNRLNDDNSAIVIIMQRLHEGDVSGDILTREADYCHLMIPMRFEPMVYPVSADGLRVEDPETGEPFTGNELGWIDPRALDGDQNLLSPQEMAQYEGMLAWPERFDVIGDRAMEYEVGSFAYAGQYQQSPVPRKGGILKREYWMDYLPTRDGKFPDFDFVCVSVDTAFTEKEENDPTGCTTWGLWTDPEDGFPKVMLLAAWRKHLPIHGVEQEPQARTESTEDYLRRCQPHWGIVEMVKWSADRFGGADVVLIEGRASGLDVINELRRLYARAQWQVVPINPKTDKYSRAIAVQPTFAQGLVYAPARDWATMVKDECAMFPKHRFKDLTDSTTQALSYLRKQGLIHRRDEITASIEEAKDYNVIRRKSQQRTPLYRA